jgi:pyridoxine 5-phosphate synthase
MRQAVTCELNLEMAATDEMVGIAIAVKPDLVTLVPEKRMELTTEGGLDVSGEKAHIMVAIKKLRDAGIPVSLFINPDIKDIQISKEIGADMVEIHTGLYSNSSGERNLVELRRVTGAVHMARELDLYANAGHGLNYQNVKGIASIKEIRGLYIGHSIISRALLVGVEAAAREMKELIGQCR